MAIPKLRNWLPLLILSLLFVAMMELVHLPAALLLGPMFAGIILAILNRPVVVSKTSFGVAQAVVGAMIAHAIPLRCSVALLPTGRCLSVVLFR